jgi:acyl-CoA thioesterase-1
MKSKVESLALIFILAGLITHCKKSAEENKEAIDLRPQILFLGNSLTAGRGVAEWESMPALIQQKIDSTGRQYRVVNGGRSGDTTAGGLARLDWYFEDGGKIKLLAIELGANDAMRGQSIPDIEKNLSRIIQKARKHDPQMKIALFQMHTFPNMGKEYTKDFSALFARVARKEKAILFKFPLRSVAGKARLNQEDGIHPNTEGTQIFAGNVWEELQKHI